MKIAFKALLKKYEPLTLVSGDRQISIKLQLNDEEINQETLDGLSKLYMKTPDLILVVLMSEDEIEGKKKIGGEIF